jgi:glycosyltransferase involved in cell wall biosynthesis
MKTCVIIPTYNEAKAIAEVVRKVRSLNPDVVVIDDGSSDNTPQIARDSGATVLRNHSNEGKGASLIKGFNYALNNGFDAVVTMDGDGQHLAEEIPHFTSMAQNSGSAVFIGNRMLKTKSMPWLRLLTNKFMSSLISKITGQDIPDSQCGFRLFKKEVLKKLRLKTSRYEIESEILIQSSRLGFKIESVAIRTVYLGEKSRIRPFRDSLRFIRFIIGEL